MPSIQKTWYSRLDESPGSKFHALMIKKANLLDDLSFFRAETHAAKGVYRLTVPLIMRLGGISDSRQLYTLQIGLGLLMYFFLAYILFDASGSYRITALSLGLIATTYFGRCYYTDVALWLDTFAYFFIILCIWGRIYPIVTLLATVALFYCDERGILAIGIVYLAIVVLSMQKGEVLSIRQLITIKRPLLFLIAGLAISICMRLFLQFNYHLHTPHDKVGYDVFLSEWGSLQLGFFYGVGAVFGLFVMTIIYAFKQKQWIWALALSAPVCIFMVAASCVEDISRSFAYVVPLSIICIKYLIDKIDNLEHTLTALLAINILVPPGLVINNTVFDNKGYSFLFDIFFKVVNIFKRISG